MSTFFNANNTITGGSINNTVIGNLAPVAGTFSFLQSLTGADLLAGIGTINLQTESGLINIASASGDLELGTTGTGNIDLGSSSLGDFDITSGAALNLQSAGSLNLSTVSGTMDFDTTSGDILIGLNTTGAIEIGSANADNVSVISSSALAVDAPTMNIGTASAVALNIGTGPNLEANGITIGRSGITTTIAGDLDIAGTISSVNQTNLAIENNHITLNSGYDGETAMSGCIVVNQDPEVAATQTLIAAGGFTSATTVNVQDATALTAGDIIIITGAAVSANNEIFAIAAINTAASPHEITIKTTTNINTVNTVFIPDSTEAGRLTRTHLSILLTMANGTWAVGRGNNDNTLSFNEINIATVSNESAIFTSGTDNDLSPSLSLSHFSCLHSAGTVSGTLGPGLTNGFEKNIVCEAFPNADSLGTVSFDLTVQPFQAGRGELLKNRIFRFTRAGQSAQLTWIRIPKTVCISCVPKADLNDNEYLDVWTADNIAGYRFWFNCSGTATGPDAAGFVLTQVDVSGSNSSAAVASVLADVITSTGNFAAKANLFEPSVVQVVNNSYTSTSTRDASEAVLDVDFVINNYEGTWINMNTGIDLY